MAEANINQIVSDQEQFKGEIKTLADRIRLSYTPEVLLLASLMLSTSVMLSTGALPNAQALQTQQNMMLTLWVQTHGIDEDRVASAVADMYRAGQTADLLSNFSH